MAVSGEGQAHGQRGHEDRPESALVRRAREAKPDDAGEEEYERQERTRHATVEGEGLS